MLARRIIPCLDVKGGRVVKGVSFVELRDAGDPVEVAARYDREGADELCFLDITASHEERAIILDVVRATAERCFMPLTVGGGVRSLEDIRGLLRAGADKVSINTAAVAAPELVTRAAEKFGTQCIVVAIDAKRVRAAETAGGGPGATGAGPESGANAGAGAADAIGAPRWEVYTHGGRRPTGLDAVDWARRLTAGGAGEVLVTSMDRDGTRDGYDLELTRAVADAVTVPVIASGGAGTPEHLYDGIAAGHASAVLAASIFHYQQHSIRRCKEYLRARGVPVRL